MHLGFLIYIFTDKIWWIWMEPSSRLSIWSTGRIPPVEYCIHLLNPGPGCLSLFLRIKWFTSWGEGVGGNIYKSDWCGPDNWSNFDPRIQSHPFLIPARAAASHRLWHPLFTVQCLKNTGKLTPAVGRTNKMKQALCCLLNVLITYIPSRASIHCLLNQDLIWRPHHAPLQRRLRSQARVSVCMCVFACSSNRIISQIGSSWKRLETQLLRSRGRVCLSLSGSLFISFTVIFTTTTGNHMDVCVCI